MRAAVLVGVAVLVAAPGWAQAPAPGPGLAPGSIKDAAPKDGGAGFSAPDAWLSRGTADVVMLDKLRAQPVTVSIKAGQSAVFGTLSVAVKSCVARPADLPQNAAAFLEVTDSKGTVPVFRGWVLSNTPSVSQFEHPVYDLRLAGCK